MEDILNKIQNIGLKIDSDSAVKIANIWFWKEVIVNMTTSLCFVLFFLIAIYVVNKIHD